MSGIDETRLYLLLAFLVGHPPRLAKNLVCNSDSLGISVIEIEKSISHVSYATHHNE
jgi:hypothetical protein